MEIIVVFIIILKNSLIFTLFTIWVNPTFNNFTSGWET